VLRTLVVGLALMLIGHSLIGTSRDLQHLLLIAFLLVTACLGVYAYAQSQQVAAVYAKKSKLSLCGCPEVLRIARQKRQSVLAWRWRFCALWPSLSCLGCSEAPNTTVERDARNSSARPSQ
jgi:hypothetical protein